MIREGGVYKSRNRNGREQKNAFRFCDSFDHYTTAQGSRKWTTFGGIIVADGRNGSNGFQPSGTSMTIDDQDEWYVGFAMNTQALGASGIFVLRSTGSEVLRLSGLVSGQMRIVRGGNGAILGTTVGAVYQTNEWHYFEVGCLVHPSAGWVKLRVDGGTVIDESGIDTDGAGTGVGNMFSIAQPGGGNAATFDDMYINDGTGATNNDFFGDVQIMAILPDEDSASFHAWGPKGGLPGDLPQFSQINENPADDDGSYVYSATPGQISLFGFPTLTFDGTVQGVQICALLDKSDVGIRSTKAVIRRLGTNYFGPQQYQSTSYLYARSVYDTDPSGGAWTVAGVNAAEFGVKEES